MPAVELRKLMKHGSSATVAIPMGYRRFYNLNPGDQVVVVYSSVLLIGPKNLEKLFKKKLLEIMEILKED